MVDPQEGREWLDVSESPPSSPDLRELEAEVDDAIASLDGLGRLSYQPRWYWDKGTQVSACSPGTDPYEEASWLLDEFDANIRLADPWEESETLRSELDVLLVHPCFATASTLSSWFTSMRSLQHFWRNGGYDALSNALDVTETRTYVVPAGRLSSVDELVEEAPQLFDLLCDDPEDCPDESEWKRETQMALRTTALEESLEHTRSVPGWIRSEARCALLAKEAPQTLKFEVWRTCVCRSEREEGWSLPLGNLYAPTEGWVHTYVSNGFTADSVYLVVDLATGDVETRQPEYHCDSLPLDEDRSFRCSSRFGAPRSLQVDPQQARRLVWLALMAEQVAHGYPYPRDFVVPDDVDPIATVFPPMGSCGGTCMPDLRIGWAYVSVEGDVVAAGIRSDCRWTKVLTDRLKAMHDKVLADATPRDNADAAGVPMIGNGVDLLPAHWGSFLAGELFEALGVDVPPEDE